MKPLRILLYTLVLHLAVAGYAALFLYGYHIGEMRKEAFAVYFFIPAMLAAALLSAIGLWFGKTWAWGVLLVLHLAAVPLLAAAIPIHHLLKYHYAAREFAALAATLFTLIFLISPAMRAFCRVTPPTPRPAPVKLLIGIAFFFTACAALLLFFSIILIDRYGPADLWVLPLVGQRDATLPSGNHRHNASSALGMVGDAGACHPDLCRIIHQSGIIYLSRSGSRRQTCGKSQPHLHHAERFAYPLAVRPANAPLFPPNPKPLIKTKRYNFPPLSAYCGKYSHDKRLYMAKTHHTKRFI